MMESLDRACVHVATSVPRRAPGLHPLLSTAENQRLQAISPRNRISSSLTAHALARLMIHEIFDVPTSAIQVNYPVDRGAVPRIEKPRFALPDGPRIDVSIAHTPTLLVVAVGQETYVGIDLENRRQHLASGWERVALAPAERQCVIGLTEPARTESLLKTWTQKEAIVKCVGTGFTSLPPGLPVDELRVRAAQLHAQGSQRPNIQPLRLRTLQVGSEYVASLATISPRSPRLLRVDGDRYLAAYLRQS